MTSPDGELSAIETRIPDEPKAFIVANTTIAIRRAPESASGIGRLR
jgi:hypothetical protein